MAELNKQNLKAIMRLAEAGITDEKAVLRLQLTDLLSIPNITVAEMTAINKLQQAIKSRTVYSFLMDNQEGKAV